MRTSLKRAVEQRISKDFGLREYFEVQRKKLEDAQRIIDELTGLAYTDELTGLPNRRVMYNALLAGFREAKKTRTAMSVAMIDIDDFRGYNNKYGHQEGDSVLRIVGEYFKTAFRKSDTPCRYGGEEFSVIMPNTDIGRAYKVAERVRKGIEALRDGLKEPITISVGLSTYPSFIRGPKGIIRIADDNLYCAKSDGKNLVYPKPDPV